MSSSYIQHEPFAYKGEAQGFCRDPRGQRCQGEFNELTFKINLHWSHYSKMEDEELEEFSSLSDEAGEISKHDLMVQTKKSSFWKGNLDLKSKPSGHSTKVILAIQSVSLHLQQFKIICKHFILGSILLSTSRNSITKLLN